MSYEENPVSTKTVVVVSLVAAAGVIAVAFWPRKAKAKTTAGASNGSAPSSGGPAEVFDARGCFTVGAVHAYAQHKGFEVQYLSAFPPPVSGQPVQQGTNIYVDDGFNPCGFYTWFNDQWVSNDAMGTDALNWAQVQAGGSGVSGSK